MTMIALLFYCIVSNLVPTSVENLFAFSNGEPVTSTLFLPVVSNTWSPTWDWQETETVEGIEFNQSAPLSIIDKQGRLHLFWDSGTSSVPKFIYHAYRNENGWIDAYPVARSIGLSRLETRPVLTQDGTLHLLWVNEIISGTQTVDRLLYASFSDGNWSQEQELHRTTRSVSGWLQVDTSQQVHLYASNGIDATQLLHAVKIADDWVWLDPIDLPQQVHWIWPDHMDGLRMYYGQSQSETRYSRWYGGRYDPLDYVIPDLDIRSRSPLLDGLNSLHIFWQAIVSVPGGTAYATLHQCLQSDLHLDPIQTVSGSASVSYPIAGADREGWFALGWTTGGNVQVALWHSCTLLGLSTAPLSQDISLSVRSIATDKETRQVCVVSRQFLDETHEVACALLR